MAHVTSCENAVFAIFDFWSGRLGLGLGLGLGGAWVGVVSNFTMGRFLGTNFTAVSCVTS